MKNRILIGLMAVTIIIACTKPTAQQSMLDATGESALHNNANANNNRTQDMNTSVTPSACKPIDVQLSVETSNCPETQQDCPSNELCVRPCIQTCYFCVTPDACNYDANNDITNAAALIKTAPGISKGVRSTELDKILQAVRVEYILPSKVDNPLVVNIKNNISTQLKSTNNAKTSTNIIYYKRELSLDTKANVYISKTKFPNTATAVTPELVAEVIKNPTTANLEKFFTELYKVYTFKVKQRAKL
jgi:hypothetical protein